MIKSRYILLFAIVVVVSTLSYLNFSPSSDIVDNEVLPVVKVYSKADSLFLRYDSLLTNKLDSVGAVGAAWAITYKGEIALEHCYGVRQYGESDSVDRETIFRLASVSKTMTGILAGILSQDSIIDLDDKIIDYLPEFKLKDSINTYDLSIRNILSHTSGLVPHAYDNLVEAKVPFNIIIDSLFRVNVSAAPGKLYGYQNVVFSLYDTICKVKTLMSFADMIKQKLFLPFGMQHASAGFESFKSNQNRALPHSRFGNGFRVLDINDRYYNTNPAAGINASISDMANFMLAINARDTSGINPVVVKEVLAPQVVSPLRWNYLRKWDRVDSKSYALGWRIIGYKGRNIAYHGGYVQGYRAEIALCTDEDLGIVFLSNSPNGVASLSIPLLLDMYFNMKDRDAVKAEVIYKDN